MIDAGPAGRVPIEPYLELYNQANAAYRKKNFSLAATLAGQSRALRKNLKAIQLQAKSLLAAGELAGATAAIDAALASAPRNATTWYWKAKILFARGEKQAARVAFEKSLDIKSTGSLADEIRLILTKSFR